MSATIPGQVRPGDRAKDVFTAAFLLAARPDVRTDRIAVLGLSHGGGTAIYVARDHEELRVLCASGSRRGVAAGQTPVIQLYSRSRAAGRQG